MDVDSLQFTDSLQFSDYLSTVLLFLYSRFLNRETLFRCQPVSAHTGHMQDFHKQYSLYPEYKWNIIEQANALNVAVCLRLLLGLTGYSSMPVSRC